MNEIPRHIQENLRTIFVFTCGVNENDIEQTVRTAYENARFPTRVYFGIIDQRTDGKFANTEDYINVKKVNIDYKYPLGLGVGRLNALMLHENQDYGLQIDAHTIFDKHWDILLLQDISQLMIGHEKSVISQRPKWYLKDDFGNIEFRNFGGRKMFICNINGCYEMDGDLTANSVGLDEHFLVSGGFVFAKLNFFTEIMPDPRIAFHGEEHVLAMRASTRGWKIFATADSHLWSFGRCESGVDGLEQSWKNIHTLPQTNGEPCVDFETPINNSKNIVKRILDGEEIGYWGAKSPESYEQYVQNLNFDYRNN